MTVRITLREADERDVHSQSGEDGIIERVFATLGVEQGTAVEFGAWDGVHLSNTAYLREKGWTTVLIEADPAKVRLLEKIAGPRTIVIGAMVMPEGEASLDRLLGRRGLRDIDFLSVDIDGDDIHVLAGLQLRPRVICIEYNPTIPPTHVFVNPLGTCQGSSSAAICQVAAKRGYELAYATRYNLFLIRREDAAAFECVDALSAWRARDEPAIFALYDGGFGLAGRPGPFRHAWSTLPVYVPRVPGALRSWPPTPARVALAYLYCVLAAPVFYVGALIRECSRWIRSRRDR